MFRLNQLRASALVLVAALAPAAAAAAPMTLRYDFTAVVTSTSYFHECHFAGDCADYEAQGRATTYQGPPVGASGAGRVEVSFDPDDSTSVQDFSFASALPVLFAPSPRAVDSYDPASRAISLSGFNASDLLEISFAPASGSGAGYFNWEQDGTGVDFAEIWLRLDGITVTDLSTVAPVPLPAALPLLGAGIAGLGLVGRRRPRAGTAA